MIFRHRIKEILLKTYLFIYRCLSQRVKYRLILYKNCLKSSTNKELQIQMVMFQDISNRAQKKTWKFGCSKFCNN